jgi:hypothetical protein
VDELAVTAIAAPVLEVAASIYLLLDRQGKKYKMQPVAYRFGIDLPRILNTSQYI